MSNNIPPLAMIDFPTLPPNYNYYHWSTGEMITVIALGIIAAAGISLGIAGRIQALPLMSQKVSLGLLIGGGGVGTVVMTYMLFRKALYNCYYRIPSLKECKESALIKLRSMETSIFNSEVAHGISDSSSKHWVIIREFPPITQRGEAARETFTEVRKEIDKLVEKGIPFAVKSFGQFVKGNPQSNYTIGLYTRLPPFMFNCLD